MGIKRNYKKFIVLLSFLFILNINVFNHSEILAKAYEPELTNPLIPATYYNGLDLNDSTSEFNDELSTIINRGFVGHSYSYNNTVLQNTDPNPNNTKQIICFYTGQSLSGGWNKEHVWAKSHGFPNSGAQPYSDAHHLRPTLNSINSSRSNSDFGEVTGGNSDNFGNRWTSDTFEPRDEVKGDVARIMFYMAIMYKDSPYNLLLVDDPHTSTSQGNGRFGNLQTLLKWHYNDPVSREEYYRNNIIYRDYQKNRNPFIDHPEFVDKSFPNSFTPVEPDPEKVSAVISLISALPLEITLDHKTQIMAAKNAYDKLNYQEQKLVTNYQKLTDALKKLNDLEKPVDPDNPDIPDIPTTGQFSVDFTKAVGIPGSYNDNLNFKVNEKDYFATSVYMSSGDFRLGSNKSKKLPVAYGGDLIKADASALEFKYTIENAAYFKINHNSNYGKIDNWHLLYSDNNGTSFTILKEGKYDQSKPIEVWLDQPMTGRFAIAVSGTTPRLMVTVVNVNTSEESNNNNFIEAFQKLQTKSSLNIEFRQNSDETNPFTIDRVGLNFSVAFPKDFFTASAKFGFLSMDAEKLKGESLTDLYRGGSLDDFFYSEEIQLLQVMQLDLTNQMELHENYYWMKYGLSVDGFYDSAILTVGYMEFNGEVYFLNEAIYSVKTLAEYYLEANLVTNPLHVNLLNYLLTK